MLSIIQSNYSNNNLLVLKYYLSKYDNIIIDFIKSLATENVIIPEWHNNALKITKYHIAHLFARSFLCMNNNEFDCINIYDKLVDPPKPHKMDSREYYKQLILSNRLDPDEMFSLSIEKLHFMFNYFKTIMNKDKSELTKIITIQRRSNLNTIHDTVLVPITFSSGYMKYTDSIKVDFANRNIGGGVLNHGCCQEEIMFLNNPELIGIMCLVKSLDNNEAVLVSGITQYSKAKYYGFDLQYDGPYESKFTQQIIVVNAIDYRKKVLDQYLEMNKKNEIQKIINGYSLLNKDQIISTGHWGCGAFKGNTKLKFMIQWLGASLTNTSLNYYIGNDSLSNELSVFYKQFENKNTQDLYNEILIYKNESKK